MSLNDALVTKTPTEPKPWEVPPDGAHAWIQWKGTDVCMDIHCPCGALLHLDGDFAYSIECGRCHQKYVCDPHIRLHPIAEAQEFWEPKVVPDEP